jgi:multidrug resistance efflux pump
MTLSGVVAPLQNVTISSSIQEPADAVYVNEGDYVHAGQTLAQLDTADLRANYNAALRNAQDAVSRIAQTRDQGALNIEQGKSALVTAQTQLAQAQQRLSLAQTTLRRDRELYAQGFLSHQVLDNDTTEYETDLQAVSSAQAGVQNAAAAVRINGNASQGLQQESVASAIAAAGSARAQADQIAVQIAKTTIASPVDGVVVNRNLNPGQYPGTSVLFTVQQIDTVYAMLNGSSDQVFLLRPGAQADVTAGSLHRVHLRGVVEAVLGQAQPGGTNFIVKVRIANPQRTLQSGMIVSAQIALPNVYGTMIPSTAFLDAAHDAVREQTRNGSTRIVTVRTLADDGSHSIVQGLSRNARVVLQDP